MRKLEAKTTLPIRNNRPLVSIIIPCKNHAKYLPFCLESILNQTFRNFEIIVLVAPSKDSSLKVAKSFKDKRIRVIELKKDVGINKTINRGILISKGKYLNLFSSDDGMKPTNLEEKKQILEENPSVGLVFSEVSNIDKDNRVITLCKYRTGKTIIHVKLEKNSKIENKLKFGDDLTDLSPKLTSEEKEKILKILK